MASDLDKRKSILHKSLFWGARMETALLMDLDFSVDVMNSLEATSQEVAGNFEAECSDRTTTELENEFFNSAPNASKPNPQHDLEVCHKFHNIKPNPEADQTSQILPDSNTDHLRKDNIDEALLMALSAGNNLVQKVFLIVEWMQQDSTDDVVQAVAIALRLRPDVRAWLSSPCDSGASFDMWTEAFRSERCKMGYTDVDVTLIASTIRTVILILIGPPSDADSVRFVITNLTDLLRDKIRCYQYPLADILPAMSPVDPSSIIAPAAGKRRAAESPCETRAVKSKTTQPEKQEKTEAQKKAAKSGTRCHQQANSQLCELGLKAVMLQPDAAAPVCSKPGKKPGHQITSLEDVLNRSVKSGKPPKIRSGRRCCAKELRKKAFQYLIEEFGVKEPEERWKCWEDRMTFVARTIALQFPNASFRCRNGGPAKTSVLEHILSKMHNSVSS
eukprot:TRINITY_DN2625_c0_g2_i1.p1 TRINITY_DN2625_c0_g2~~TRINITY_DN2625_c0_g2_i1.p1  ORF type:complete len:459 (-),score=36.75 TRINITY_DN2625_c0_g2_i1:27-1364(-)